MAPGSLAALDLQLAFLGSLILLGKLGTLVFGIPSVPTLNCLKYFWMGFLLQSSRHNVPRPLG